MLNGLRASKHNQDFEEERTSKEYDQNDEEFTTLQVLKKLLNAFELLRHARKFYFYFTPCFSAPKKTLRQSNTKKGNEVFVQVSH